jgi:membrane-associated protein
MVDIANWIANAGVIGALLIIGAMVFAESGLLVGIFLPGDTLLLAAGFFAAQGHLPLVWVLIAIFVGSILGDNFGYFFGRQTGKRLFTKKDGLFLRQAYIRRAETFFQKYGAKTILFARFLPYVRTFAPIVAGAVGMRRRVFMVYNFLGALLWTVTTVMIGYWLGERLPDVEHYLVPTIIVSFLVVFAHPLWRLFGNRRNRKLLLKELDTAAAPQPKRKKRRAKPTAD